jgi:hypothetical protein
MTTEYWVPEEKYARRVGKVAEIDARHVRPLSELRPCTTPGIRAPGCRPRSSSRSAPR